MPAPDYLAAIKRTRGLLTVPRIEFVAWTRGARTYLEIGVNKGETFQRLGFRCKIGVDPCFLFDIEAARDEKTFLHQTTSDDFFARLRAGDPELRFTDSPPFRRRAAFDVIFIDGLHTFAQSFRDFENSLAFAHDDTVWIIDDTVPSDPYSALPDLAFSHAVRKQAGFTDESWHGDVYKTILAIHDKYPGFAYCTLMRANPQTIVWKTADTGRKPAFSSLAAIDGTDYFGLLRHADLMRPLPDFRFPEFFGKAPPPEEPADPEAWKRLIYTRIRAC